MMPLHFYNDIHLAKAFCLGAENQTHTYAYFWQDVLEQSVAIADLEQSTWAL